MGAPQSDALVFFGATGQARLVGANPILSEAGTATILLESDVAQPNSALYAITLASEQDRTRILCATSAPNGTQPRDFTVRYTIDGSDPTADSPKYSKPVRSTPQLRAAIFVDDRIVAAADGRTQAVSTRSAEVQTARRTGP